MENKLNQGIYNSDSDDESIFSDDSQVFRKENNTVLDESSDEDEDANINANSDIDTDTDDCNSLPDDEYEDNTVYSFTISLQDHMSSIQFIRNQGDQYDISGILNNNTNTLRLSTVSGNKNKLLTLEINNPNIIDISNDIDEENHIIKFGMTYPDEFIPNSNLLTIVRGKHNTTLISTDNEGDRIDHSFRSTNASGYVKYLDWDGSGVEMYNVGRYIDTNKLIQFSNDTIELCNKIDDMVMHITVFPSVENLFFSVCYEYSDEYGENCQNNIINSTYTGLYMNNRNMYSGDKIEILIPFSDIYEILADPTLLLNNARIIMYIMNKMPLVIKKKLNNSNLSIAIIQSN